MPCSGLPVCAVLHPLYSYTLPGRTSGECAAVWFCGAKESGKRHKPPTMRTTTLQESIIPIQKSILNERPQEKYISERTDIMPDINPEYISKYLSAHTPGPEGVFRHSSVLIPIFETERGYELLFCKRSMTLRRQPGDVCFPGGSREGDESAIETALRETCEEIGIEKKNIEKREATLYET